MARMALAAVVGFSVMALGAPACLAQGSAAPPPPPAMTQPGAQPSPPLADDGGGHRAGMAALDACRGDMKTLCGGVARGGGRKFACLKDNQAGSIVCAACRK